MKFQLALIALTLVLLTSVGASSEMPQTKDPIRYNGEINQPEPTDQTDSETAPRWTYKRSRNKGGTRCRSEADQKDDALDFCESQLKCADKTPAQTTTCTGQSGRWICYCK